MTSNREESKLLKDCFFTAVVGSVKKFICKLCAEGGASHTIEVSSGSGYTNFKNHLSSNKHRGQWEDRFNAYKARLLTTEETTTSDSYYESSATSSGGGGSSSMMNYLVPKYGAKTNAVFGLLRFFIDSKTRIAKWHIRSFRRVGCSEESENRRSIIVS